MFAGSIDAREVYTRRAEDYIRLIKRFTDKEVKDVGNYSILKQIASGSFGQVYLAFHKLLRARVCLKRGERNGDDIGASDNLMREFYYLKEFGKHPNIVKLYEVIFTEEHVYLVLEYYAEGDLFEYLKKRKAIPIEEALRIFTQLCGAVFYMHQNGCCHRDLKLENVLLDRNFNVKLSDFGFTREVPLQRLYGSSNMTFSKASMTDICGTEPYMAPELIRKEAYSGIKTDIWALGVILYAMVSGEMPFDDSLPTSGLEKLVLQSDPDYSRACFNGQPELVELLTKLLAKGPENRPNSLEEVLNLPLFEPYGGTSQISTSKKLIEASTEKPSLSGADRSLLKSMVRLGFDKDCVKKSILSEKLDPLDGFWRLLKEKRQKAAERKKYKRRSRSVLRLTSTKSLSSSKSILGSAKHYAKQAVGTVSSASATPSRVPESPLRTVSESIPESTAGKEPVQVDDAPLEVHSTPNPSEKVIHEGTSSSPREEMASTVDSTSGSGSTMTSKKHKTFSFLRLLRPRKYGGARPTEMFKLSGETSSRESLFKKLFPSAADSIKSLHERRSLEAMGLTNKKASSPLASPNANHPRSVQRTRSMKTDVLVIEPEAAARQRSHQQQQQSPLPLQHERDSLSKRVRPRSVVSTYSIQTTISETSNASGYLTGYSTDNPRSHTQSVPGSPQARPLFTRAMSDWSMGSRDRNASSRAESPSSSFTGRSRTASIDSSSRSSAGVLRPRKSASSGVIGSLPLRRRKSRLRSKISTKWNFGMVTNSNSIKRYKRNAPKKIIEEEEESSVVTDSDELLEEEDEGFVDMGEAGRPKFPAPAAERRQGSEISDLQLFNDSPLHSKGVNHEHILGNAVAPSDEQVPFPQAESTEIEPLIKDLEPADISVLGKSSEQPTPQKPLKF